MPQTDITTTSQEFTTAEELREARRARMSILQGAQSYSENGRSAMKASLDAVNATIKDLEDKLAAETAAATPGGADVLVRVARS